MSSQKLPEGWVECALADIVTVNPKNNAAEELTAGFVPMSHAPTGYYGELQFQEKVWGEIKKSYTNFANGDVIFAKVTPCFENGKAAVVENMPNGIGAGSSEFYVLRPLASAISPKLIYALIKSQPFMQQGAHNMTGAVGLRRVPRAFVETFPVALPPSAEQTAIADKLDTLLAQVETTKARLERIPQILKRFRQSVLAAGVSGRLTGVTCVSLGALKSVADIVSGVAFKKAQYSNSGSKLLQIANVGYGAAKWDSVSYIPTDLADEFAAFSLAQDDLVMALNRPITNDTLKVAAISVDDLPATLYQRVARIRCRPELLNSGYLFLQMQGPDFQKKVELNLKGSDQPYLNTSSLGAFDIHAPELEEQTQIVHRVNQLFAHADLIGKQVQAAQKAVNNLTQSILAKAFRGELTEQWRKDNPELISGENSAAALLERIKAERAATAKPKRRTNRA